MNSVHDNAAPTNGLWGALKQIVTINGFFGAGFFKDFSEGWKEAVAEQKAAQSAAKFIDCNDEDEAGNISVFESIHDGYDDPDSYALGGVNNPYWKPHDPGSDYDPFDADMIANSCIHPDSNLW